MNIALIILLIMSWPNLALADSANIEAEHEQEQVKAQKTKTWWQIRSKRGEHFYPHQPHMQVMEAKGDSCMLCHAFSPNKIRDKKLLRQLVTINNEAGQGICHSCHLDSLSAPFECQLCHVNVSSIWPENHNYNYAKNHSNDAQFDEDSCSECHKDLTFCTDCHFNRQFGGANRAGALGNKADFHILAYKTLHAMDARISPLECASCHQANFCSDCHWGIN